MQLSNLYRALGITFMQPRKFSAASRLRFFNFHTKELIDALDHLPTQADILIINRCVRNMWQLLKEDHLLDKDKVLSEHEERCRNAAENRLRYDLKALNLYPIGGPVSLHGKKPEAGFEAMLASLMAERGS